MSPMLQCPVFIRLYAYPCSDVVHQLVQCACAVPLPRLHFIVDFYFFHILLRIICPRVVVGGITSRIRFGVTAPSCSSIQRSTHI